MSDPVSITLAVIDRIIQAYQVFDKIKNLPKAFQTVQESLPVARSLLLKVRDRASVSQLQEEEQEGLDKLGAACQKRAEELDVLCQKFKERVGKVNSDKLWDKFKMSYAALVSHGTRVEELMTALLKDIDLLWKDKIMEKLSLSEAQKEQQRAISDAIKDIKSVNESVSDREIGFAQNISIAQVVAPGSTGTQVISAMAGGRQTILGDIHNSGFQNNNIGTINLDQSQHYYTHAPQKDHYPDGPYFLVPFRKNAHFVGRDDILDRLKEALLETQSVQSMAVYGLGGVGKTQVAMQLAHYAKELGDWSVCWLSALSMNSFQQSCTKMVGDVLLQQTDDEDARLVVQRYLESKESGRWFLIVDNADDISTVMGSKVDDDSEEKAEDGIIHFLPKNGDNCVLFTTRTEEVADAVADDTEKLENMSEEEAKTLFRGLYPKALMDDSTVALLHELTFLPLAISQAAAYMKKTRTSASQYLTLLEDKSEAARDLLSREFPDRTRYTESHHAVAKTWLVSFKQIEKTDATAANLLAFLSQIEPRAIPKSILPPADNVVDFQNAIGTLFSYAFLSQRDDGETFDMHSLVHISAYVWVQVAGDADRVRRETVDHLYIIFSSDRWEDRRLWRAYLPHVLRVLHIGKERGGWEEGECWLGAMAARCFYVEGKYTKSIRLLENVLAAETFLRSSDHARLIWQQALASSYVANCQNVDAIQLLEYVVQTRERTSQPDHAQLLSAQHGLASAYHANGQIKDAMQLLEKVVQAYERILQPDDMDFLASQTELARVYHANGRSKDAIQLLERVIHTRGKITEPDHPDQLTSQHTLARMYRQNGQAQDAIKLHEHVVRMEEGILERDHPNLISSQYALALAYDQNGQIKEATQLLEHVVQVRRALATDHPTRLDSEHMLAVLYRDNQRVKEAIPLFEHVLKHLAADDDEQLITQMALGRAYRHDGQTKNAVQLLEHVVQVRKDLAENDTLRLGAEHSLALAYHQDGQVEQAIDLMRHVVSVESQELGPADCDKSVSKEKLESWLEGS